MHVLEIMHNKLGDKKIFWEEDNKKDISKAEKLFKEKIKDGFMAFGYKAGEKLGKLIRGFDPTFDRIVLTPAPMGG